MGLRVGVDLFRIQRMEQALRRADSIYFSQTFTRLEYETGLASERPSLWFAERLALKEAAFKSLGTAWTEGMSWVQIEALSTAYGAPSVVLSGEMSARAAACGVCRLSASVSNDGDYVIAVVTAETDPVS
ncbi:holo-ACP synthase [Lawsonibacter celer]|uniref:holo-ACP synthase n=1 Tax=Lawsonibacter celer TaxID=2986526 RepID=UPI0016483040|nr:4'-phosphopantetheinyl transferase superfamily protein [Lawsonibacter celer]